MMASIALYHPAKNQKLFSQAANAQKWPICAFIYRTFLALFSERYILEKPFSRKAQKFKPENSYIRTLLRWTHTSKYTKNEIF